jgi:hypothetical protein
MIARVMECEFTSGTIRRDRSWARSLFLAGGGCKFPHFNTYLLASLPSFPEILCCRLAFGARSRLVIQFFQYRNLLEKVQHLLGRTTHRFPPPGLAWLLLQRAARASAASDTASCCPHADFPRSTMGRCFFEQLLAPSRFNASSNFCKFCESIKDTVAIDSSQLSTIYIHSTA